MTKPPAAIGPDLDMATTYHSIHDGHQSLDQSFSGIIADKQRAIEARRNPPKEIAEHSRDVYASVCAAVGHALAANGFRYSPSGKKCSKKAGNFAFDLQFHSDLNNVPGQLVGLQVSGSVRSPKFKAWSVQQGLANPGSYITGSQLGYLSPVHLDLKWNLAAPETRPQVTQGIIRAIEDLALPWFARFLDQDRLRQQLIENSIPAFDIYRAIHFLMYAIGRDAASAAARNFLLQRPGLIGEFQIELAQIKTPEPLRVLYPYAKGLAILTRFYDLLDVA